MSRGWDGFGKRLREAMLAKGFVNRKGDPDVTRFALAHGWIPNYVYRWLADESIPDKSNLDKLGEALSIPPARLLFGDEVNRVPGNPRKRGGRKVVGLVAALGVWLGLSAPTAWGSGVLADQNAPGGSVETSDNVRGIMSRWRRRIYHPWWSSPAPSTSGSLVLTAELA
jgi:transcriptional regulator with XRE-family HTH domain